MEDLPIGISRNWRFRPYFNLRNVLVLMTLVVIGIWYVYQRPFAVMSRVSISELATAESDPFSNRPSQWGREVKYVRRVWGGTRRHGPRSLYDSAGVLRLRENYRNGQKHGEIIKFNSSGTKESLETYFAGYRQGPMKRWNGNGEIIFEGRYERGVPHGRFVYRYGGDEPGAEVFYDHGSPTGKWSWFPSTSGGPNESAIRPRHGKITGQWQDGAPEGPWEWLDADGRVYIAAQYKSGQPSFTETSGLNPRTLESLVAASADTPTILLQAFDTGNLQIRDEPLKDFVLLCHRALDVPLIVTHSAMQTTESLSSPVTFDADNTPFLIAFENMLKPLELGCDYRYCSFFIDTATSIANWQDMTGVLELKPPPGSRLEREWNRTTNIDFVGVPLKVALSKLSDQHRVRIELSSTLAEHTAASQNQAMERPVTVSLNGITFKNVLAVILSDVGCKASIDGEALVVELQ